MVAIIEDVTGELILLAPNGPFEAASLSFQSDPGVLSIIDGDSALFDIVFDPDNAGRITLTSKDDGPITIDEPLRVRVAAGATIAPISAFHGATAFSVIGVPTSNVPEPAANVLVLLGGLALLGCRKRQR